MTLAKHDAEKLHGLLCEIWDQGPSADCLARLESLAQQLGDQAYLEIISFTGIHSELASSASSSRAFEASVAAILKERSTSLLKESTTSKSHAPASYVVQKLSNASRGFRSFGWLTLAAGILVIVGLGALWQNFQPTDSGDQQAAATHKLFRPAQPVATVSEDNDAVWSSAQCIDVDKTLMQGQLLILEQGSAQVSMACGADMVLQAPCTVKLVSDDLVELISGKLTAQAAAWATGFVIETKGLKITDLGTRFAVSVDDDGVSEAHVLEGSVLAEPLRSVRPKRSSMLLKKGEAIRVNLSQSSIDLIAAKNSDFIDHLPKFRPLKPIRIWNTGIGGVVGQNDLHWTITAGIPANGPYPRPAVITEARPAYLDNMPTASQWISVDTAPIAAPDSVHTFETRFNLTGYDLDTVCMVGLFLVDDAINQLSINGNSIPFKPWVPKWVGSDFRSFRAIVIDEGFVPGENVISIDLYNLSNQPARTVTLNPLGLRVEWQAFGSETLKDKPVEKSLLLGLPL